MKRTWDLKPNLLDCLLEDRIVPAPMNNLGMIVQTTSGLSLVIPFPGAVNMSSISSGGGTSGSAASVSGTAMPTSLYMTGRGLSQFVAGNITGNSAIAGAAGTSATGVNMTIQVGSGADDASAGGSSAASSSRNNPATGGNTAPIMAYIGQVGTSSSSTSPMSSTSSSSQTQSAPVPALAPLGVTIPGSPNGTTPAQSSPMNPSLGAPRLLRGLGTSLMPALPGGLGVGSLTSPAGSPGGY